MSDVLSLPTALSARFTGLLPAVNRSRVNAADTRMKLGFGFRVTRRKRRAYDR